jgi:hypothetical protein
MHRECATDMIKRNGGICKICNAAYVTHNLSAKPETSPEEMLILTKQAELVQQRNIQTSSCLRLHFKPLISYLLKVYPELQNASDIHLPTLFSDLKSNHASVNSLYQRLMDDGMSSQSATKNIEHIFEVMQDYDANMSPKNKTFLKNMFLNHMFGEKKEACAFDITLYEYEHMIVVQQF